VFIVQREPVPEFREQRADDIVEPHDGRQELFSG
jgi:hypothetical protein